MFGGVSPIGTTVELERHISNPYAAYSFRVGVRMKEGEEEGGMWG